MFVCGDGHSPLTCPGLGYTEDVLRQADLSARRPPLRGVTWKKLLRWVESRWAKEGDSSAPGGIKKTNSRGQVAPSLYKQNFVLSKALMLLFQQRPQGSWEAWE